MLIFNEKAYFFRRKKGEEQKKTRSILLNLVPCYLETVLIGQPLFLFCPKFKNRLRHTFRADFYRNLSVFSFTPAHGYRPSVPSIAFILQIRSESFSEACLLRNVPGTLRTIGLHIKNYSVRSTAQKIDLLPDRLTTYGAKDIDGMQVIHQTVGPWTIHSFIHIATSFINP